MIEKCSLNDVAIWHLVVYGMLWQFPFTLASFFVFVFKKKVRFLLCSGFNRLIPD